MDARKGAYHQTYLLLISIAGAAAFFVGAFQVPTGDFDLLLSIFLVAAFTFIYYSPLHLLNNRFYLSNTLVIGCSLLIGIQLTSLVFLAGLIGGALLDWFIPRARAHTRTIRRVVWEAGNLLGINLIPMVVIMVIFGLDRDLGSRFLAGSDAASTVLNMALIFGLLHGGLFWAGSRLSQQSSFMNLRWDTMALILIEMLPALLSIQLIVAYPVLNANALIASATLTILLAILLNYLSTPRLELERRLHELSAFREISEALPSEADLERMLSVIYQQVREILGVENFYVALFDPDKQEIWYPLAVKAGVRQNWSRRQILERLTDRVILNSTPILIRDHGREELHRIGLPAGEDSPLAWIGVPLKAGDHTTGCLAAFSTSPQTTFSENDLYLLSILAGLASPAVEIALHNALLTREFLVGRDRITTVLNSVQDGILLFDLDGRILLANERIQALTGHFQSDFIGKQLADLPENVRQVLGYSAESDGHSSYFLFSQETRKLSFKVDGVIPERHVDLMVFPVLSQDSQVIGWVLTVRDITEEVANREAQELIGETLVHDLRAPISSVISALEMIQEAHASGDPTDLIAPSLQIAQRIAKRVLGMVETLLEIARLQSGKFVLDLTPVEMRSLVDGSIAEFSVPAREYGIRLANDVPPDLPVVEIDRGKILRVLNNLIDNALKFTDEGGEVRISAEYLSEDQLAFRVSDTGPGIPEEYRVKIFERFSQIPGQTGRRKGSGLGLTYCKLALEAHKGRIWVEPREGGGSVFVFSLPIKQQINC